jgi:chemotaxis protein MotA
VLSANIVFLPMASKIKRISELECTRMTLIIEGVLAIQSGANPRLVAHKLRSLAPVQPGKSAAAEEAA